MTLLSRRAALQVLGAGAGAVAAVRAEAAAPHGRRGRQPDDVGLLYDSTRCIGCRACVTRCKEANGLPQSRTGMNGADYDAPLDLDARTKNVIRIAQDGDRTAFVKAGCMHCIDPACINACMVGALAKRAGGVVGYDVDLCVGCRYCQVVCPFNVPKFDWKSAFDPRIVKCELCRHRKEGPACAEACPRQALLTGKVDDLLAEAHRRVGANPKLYQPKVYGESEIGGTQVLYLAALPFEKLGLPALGEEPVPSLAWAVHRGIYKGFIAPVVLYAAFAFVTLRSKKAGKGEEP
jgi:Fe-S-cluster-containing dehydrogenase component